MCLRRVGLGCLVLSLAAAAAAGEGGALASRIRRLAGELARPERSALAERELRSLCWHATRPGAEAERRLAAATLVALLEAEATPPAVKAGVVERLGAIGRAEAVPALARRLADRELREASRRALERNPSAEASRALRQGLATRDAGFRAALAQALGARRDAASVPLLVPLVDSPDEALRLAAVEALARIGDPTAIPALRAAMARRRVSPGARRRVGAAYVALAAAVATRGERRAAVQMYGDLLKGTAAERAAALLGLGRAGGAAALPALLEALDGDDRRLRGAAAQALAAVPGPEATKAVAARARKAEPALKATLLDVLAARGDPAGLGVALSAAGHAESAVRLAAIRAAGAMRSPAAAPRLIELVRYTAGAERAAAESALRRIPGKQVTLAIVEALAASEPDARRVLVRVLGARGDPDCLTPLRDAASDPDPAVRAEARRALSQLGHGEPDAPKPKPVEPRQP